MAYEARSSYPAGGSLTEVVPSGGPYDVTPYLRRLIADEELRRRHGTAEGAAPTALGSARRPERLPSGPTPLGERPLQMVGSMTGPPLKNPGWRRTPPLRLVSGPQIVPGMDMDVLAMSPEERRLFLPASAGTAVTPENQADAQAKQAETQAKLVAKALAELEWQRRMAASKE